MQTHQEHRNQSGRAHDHQRIENVRTVSCITSNSFGNREREVSQKLYSSPAREGFMKAIKDSLTARATMVVATVVTTVQLAAVSLASAAGSVNITPNTSLPGTAGLKTIAGGVLSGAEVLCVIGFIVSAVAMAYGHTSNSMGMHQKGRMGVLWALIALVLLGSVNYWTTGALAFNMG